MTAEPWKAYRRHAAQTENAADIFIQAYDRIISLIYSATRAIEDQNIEKKTEDLKQVFTFIAHLESGLDFERGGEAAQVLSRFYALARKEIFKASAQLDAAALSKTAEHFAEVRKIWEKAQALSAGSSSGYAAVPPPRASSRVQGTSTASGIDQPEPSHSPGWSA